MNLRYSSLLVLLLLTIGCGNEIEPGTVKISRPVVAGVRLQTARVASQPLVYEAVGTVQAGITSNLAAKVIGAVETIAVHEGDQVNKGDILLTLDQSQAKAGLREAQASLAEAKQALAAARAAAELATATYERYLSLKRENSVSDQEFDEVAAHQRQAEAMVSAAESRVKQAGAAVTAARATFNDTLITAPHTGVISAKLVDKGDLATPGRTLLILETTGGYRVDLVVPEAYIDDVYLGQTVLAGVPALNLADLVGTVGTIAPAADPGSRSFLVKIVLPTGVPVKSGMFARVEIPLKSSDQLLVPLTAVLRPGQLTGLFVVDHESVAHFRLIRLGRVFDGQVEVLSGLHVGDRYVVEPPPALVDGAKVEESS
jgi:RND family efflux transporter MFP subunit